MLGDILAQLTDTRSAATMLDVVATPELRDRVHNLAVAEGIPVGRLVASKVRHMIDHAGEEIWVDLIGRMSNSPQPGAAAMEAMLDRAFAPSSGGCSCSKGG